MNGIKIVARHKNLAQAQDKDLVLATELVTIPIVARTKLSLTLSSGVVYGLGNTDFPIATYEHGLGYAPMFRGWIETVDTTTGLKSGQKYSLPVLVGAFVYSLKSDKDHVILEVVSSGATYAPTTTLVYDSFVYVFGSRVPE